MLDESHEFVVPVKKVKTQEDVKIWEKSETYMVRICDTNGSK